MQQIDIVQKCKFVRGWLIVHPNEITKQGFRLEGSEIGGRDLANQLHQLFVTVGRKVISNRFDRATAVGGEPVAIKILDTATQIVFSVIGQYRSMVAARLSKQYAIDVGE